jgi:hypothetical protein
MDDFITVEVAPATPRVYRGYLKLRVSALVFELTLN